MTNFTSLLDAMHELEQGLANGMCYLLDETKTDDSMRNALNHITQVLHLSKSQAVILTAVAAHSAQDMNGVPTTEMPNELRISIFQYMEVQDDLQYLLDKKFIYRKEINKNAHYMLTTAARKAIRENRSFDIKLDSQTCKGLIQWNDLQPKSLFFSSSMQEKVNELSSLLHTDCYERLNKLLSQHNMRKGLTCLFYGAPGTGKTELVQQLAIDTYRDIMQVNLSELRSKWCGESEKQVQQVFDEYRSCVKKCQQTPILLFNEADAFFSRRIEDINSSCDKEENTITNIILQEMEKLDGILICTTNMANTLDEAMERRFLYKIEFERPNAEVREKIWNSMMPDLSDQTCAQLAKDFSLSGGQIENVARKQLLSQAIYGNSLPDIHRIQQYCKDEINTYASHSYMGFA